MSNQLFYGDNLEVLRKHIKDEYGSVFTHRDRTFELSAGITIYRKNFIKSKIMNEIKRKVSVNRNSDLMILAEYQAQPNNVIKCKI